MLLPVSYKWKLTVIVLPWVCFVVLCKYIAHACGVEFLSFSSLLGALISANVFLIGFLISGVLGDYKEGERLPGEMACSLETIIDECQIIAASKKDPVPTEFMVYVKDFIDSLIAWLHKDKKTISLMNDLAGMNGFLYKLEPLTQANFIARLKQEQNLLRRFVTRIHTIRDTDFNPAGYAIAEVLSTMLCLGLVFTKIDPFVESVFFVAFISFVLIYMVFLIKELDNPFSYYEEDCTVRNISLKPLFDLRERISKSLAAGETDVE